MQIVQLDEDSQEFVKTGGFDHPYPTTQIQWIPDKYCSKRDLLATTGDYLRLWHVTETGVQMEHVFNLVRGTAAAYAQP